MDRITALFGRSEVTIKPEILFYYAAIAVLVTIFVNWALATLLIMLKPFTCAAIMMAFIRPDLIEKFIREENLVMVSGKLKGFFLALTSSILKLCEQVRIQQN